MPEGEKEQGGLVLLFETTHAALAAEEALIEGGLWCDMVPRPPGTSDDLCGLAVEVDEADTEEVMAALRRAGLEFNTYYRDGGNER